MKKIIFTFAMFLTTIITMAQSQFYVIMKDGSGASYPEDIVDSLTFDKNNGAKIYGLSDIINRMNAMQKSIDSLKKVMTQLSPADLSEKNHEYVDLGLPSGTLWATCNVGADKASDYGYYICWGETDKKIIYSRTGGKWYNVEISSLRSQGVIDGFNNLTSKYDAATVLWGDDWRMPTNDEFNELLSYCSQQWSVSNGEAGILFTSTFNSKSIFLPCAGMIMDNELVMEGTRGYYISSTATEDNSCGLYLAQDDIRRSSTSRSHGRSIRAVRKDKNKIPYVDHNLSEVNGVKYVDLGLPSGTKWAAYNLGAKSDQELGDVYQWGKTKPYSTTDSENYSGITVDDLKEKGVIDSQNNLTSSHDAASYKLGDMWRMPTSEECEELLSNCKISRRNDNGVEGYLFIGLNAKTIFFPISDSLTEGISYWSSTAYDGIFDDTVSGILNTFDNPSVSQDWAYLRKRDLTFPIRPVLNK